MMENIVYNELCYNGYSVNVGTFDSIEKNKDGRSVRKTNEIDFYAVKGIKQYYIQVTADMSDAAVKMIQFTYCYSISGRRPEGYALLLTQPHFYYIIDILNESET